MEQIHRKLSQNILFSLKNNPVVFVNGPRQAGKSTLVKKLAQKDFAAEYISFDNTTQRTAAMASPHSFLTFHKGPVILDEVQMVPELFRALKEVVDDMRLQDKAHSNGRFLLTGSANIMALPKLSDPLVGRMNLKTLYPFAVSEVIDSKGDFLERLFSNDFSAIKRTHISLAEAIRFSTFPEISGKEESERNDWFDGYLTTILQRDVRMLSELEKISLLPNMLRILAARAGSLMNDASIARDVGLNAVTSKSYRSILQAMFLTFEIKPWYRNINKRLVKSPKGYLIDTLFLCHLLDWSLEDMRERKPNLYGHVVENFVATELIKLLSFSDIRAQLLHFRTSDDKEIDFILERPNGTLAAIEVKSSETVTVSDFKCIKELQELASNDLVCGIVMYAGSRVVPFGKNLFAVPFDALWE